MFFQQRCMPHQDPPHVRVVTLPIPLTARPRVSNAQCAILGQNSWQPPSVKILLHLLQAVIIRRRGAGIEFLEMFELAT